MAKGQGLIEIGFGGGCHWCTEAVFQYLRGVYDVRQGFARSCPPDDQWSEAVWLEFDPEIISLDVLVQIHLGTHASRSNHSRRDIYRSAVYVSDDEWLKEVQILLSQMKGEGVITQALILTGFQNSPAAFQNYYQTDPKRPFCQTYIDPKLAKLRRDYAEFTL